MLALLELIIRQKNHSFRLVSMAPYKLKYFVLILDRPGQFFLQNSNGGKQRYVDQKQVAATFSKTHSKYHCALEYCHNECR